MKELILQTADDIIMELRDMGCTISYDEAVDMAKQELAHQGYNTIVPVGSFDDITA